MVIHELLDVLHDLAVSTMGFGGHCGEKSGAGGGWLRVQHERHREETFDEFDEGITAVGLASRGVQ
jgi:hypothetical protein